MDGWVVMAVHAPDDIINFSSQSLFFYLRHNDNQHYSPHKKQNREIVGYEDDRVSGVALSEFPTMMPAVVVG